MKKILFVLLTLVLSINFLIAQENSTEENNSAVSSRIDYISPNNDGVQDELVVPLDIKDKRYISEWSFVVTDKNGNVLRTIGNKHKRADTATDVFKNLFSGEGIKGFFDNVGKTFAPKSGVEVPTEVRWNGVFDSGEIAPDGTYFYYLTASDDNENTSRTKTYQVVKYGDVNGDGQIKASDYVLIKNNIMGSKYLSGTYAKAADVNKDGKVKASDYVLIKNSIMSNKKITQ